MAQKRKKISAFCIAGTNSGCGKTTVSMAICAALQKKGLRIAPFKCGPDYIDPSYLAAITKNPCVNLDTWMMGEDAVKESFQRNIFGKDVAIIEGVMGLFDGAKNNYLKGSTASCAKILNVPIILVVNAAGIGGSIAAIVKGFSFFIPQINIIGVIANNVGSSSHVKLLEKALKNASCPPLLGAIPKDNTLQIPERHLGLLPFAENSAYEEFFEKLAKIAEENIDLNKIIKLSRIKIDPQPHVSYPTPQKIVAIAKDEAFNFYYHDNLHFLRLAGFDFVEFSPIRDRKLPSKFDLIYIGGGFPEIFARELSDNCEIRREIKNFANSGGQIFAECGGFMYLTESLITVDNIKFPMCGIIPGYCKMKDRLHSLGYREIKTLHELPFCKKGKIIRGHEFHWSEFVPQRTLPPLFYCKDTKGKKWKDGIRMKNTYASYIHLHLGSQLYLQSC